MIQENNPMGWLLFKSYGIDGHIGINTHIIGTVEDADNDGASIICDLNDNQIALVEGTADSIIATLMTLD